MAQNRQKNTHPPLVVSELSQLLGQLTALTGLRAAVLDASGAPLVPANQEDPAAAPGAGCTPAHCAETWAALYKVARASRAPSLHSCGAGRQAACLPIYLEDTLAYVWVLCGAAPAKAGGHIPLMNQKTLCVLQPLIASLSRSLASLQNANTQLAEMDGAVARLAYENPLVHLPNYHKLGLDFAQNPVGCLLLVDIQDLAHVNAVYGHDTGDALLLALRDYLQALTPAAQPPSTLYRLYAADYGLLVRGCNLQQLSGMAAQIIEDCASPWSLDVMGQPVQVSFGVTVGILSLADLPAADMESLRAAVIYTINRAVQSGGVAVYDGNENRIYQRRHALERELRAAVSNGMRGFSLRFQPLVDPGTSLWRGVEALCRWNSETYGTVSPEEFIPICEGTGLIGIVGLWVLQQASAAMVSLGLHEVEHFMLDVNLSPLQLSDTALGDKILSLLAQTGYPPEKLCLEITESSAVELTPRLLATLEGLREKGIHFALDDFGVGYASLSSLYRLPIDTIKTDRSLVQGIEQSDFLQRLFYVMGELAHVNGMKIVAEGVESEAQVQVLLMEGADYFQGYHFAKPLTKKQLARRAARFYTSSTGRVDVQYSRADLISSCSLRGGYVLPPELYNILNRCMHILFSDADANSAISKVLAIVGQALGVSRAYVYMHDQGTNYVLTHDWCAPGVPSFHNQLPSLHLDQLGPQWLQHILREDMLISVDVDTLPEPLRGLMHRFGVKAFAAFSILQDGQHVGTVNFNDSEKVRYWAREDVRMLQLLSNMIASALTKSNLMQKLESQKQKLQSIMDQIDALIYVNDPVTGEIMFANKATLETFGIDELEGLLCWQTIQGQPGPCAFCPYEQIRGSTGEMQHYKLYNQALGDYLQISVSMIEWEEGRMGMLCSAFNINELIDRQHALEISAGQDALTGILNRAGLLEAAARLLHKSRLVGRPVSLAFVDVDGLKRENDLRGHKAGDALLTAMVDCIRANTRDSDVIGRYGGDEFLVLFSGCEEENARRSLEKMRGQFARLDQPEINKYHSFSYGVSHTGEVKGQPAETALETLINLADSRMLTYKNAHRRGRQ